MKQPARARIHWRREAPHALELLGHHLAVGVRGHFSPESCALWTAGIHAARALWTVDFDAEQFSLGRAFYTHLEQGRSQSYFAHAAASDASVEAHAPGLQADMRALATSLVGGRVRARRGWCGPGIHIFPAGGHVATRGGVIHYDLEGLTSHHVARRARALSVVAMLAPPLRGGGLRVWSALYDGREEPDERAAQEGSALATYRVGDVVMIDSYRLHQIQPFAGEVDRVSATIHLAEVDDGYWESWF